MRILLHAGTPKTGTTSLQFHLHAHRERLLEHSTLYPGDVGVHGDVPKHQWVIGLLRSGATGELIDRVNAIAATEGAGCDRMILSTEGLFNHWADIPPQGLDALRGLAARYRIELCVWFRDPAAYVRSYYCQALKNPPEHHPLYGRDITIDALLDDPWFRRHLEYDRYVDEVTAVLGAGTVRPFGYTSDTVVAFCSFYDLPLSEDLTVRENIGIRSFGVDALRTLNRHCGSGVARAEAVAAILQLDRSIESPAFALTAQETDRIAAISDRSVTVMRERFGIILSPE